MDNNALTQAKKRMWMNLALSILIIVGFSIYRSQTGADRELVMLSQEGMTLTGEDGRSISFLWTDIQDAELRKELDYGECAAGTDNGKEKSGIWINEEFGEYDLYVNPKVSESVVITLSNSRKVVVNIENNKTTESLLEQLELVMNK